jgi:hypothetical protein
MIRLILLALLLSTGVAANAYPQMVRHGYTSCTSCHAVARGGGVLTPYGRALSKELLSTWGYEGEEQWHWGALDEESVPQWLRIGADYRSAQVHTKDELATIGRYIEMQEEVEVAGQWGDTWVSMTGSSDTLQESKPWDITQYYIATNIAAQTQVRAGRFVPRFGINVAEHVLSTRGPLGFGIAAQRDTVEITHLQQSWDVSAAYSFGELEDETSADAVYTQANYSIGERDRIGVSVGQEFKEDKALSVGIHGLVGLSEHLFIVSDTVWTEKRPENQESNQSLYHFVKFGWEMEKGLQLILLEDYKKEDLSDVDSVTYMYGAGFQFFPRPHFEVQGVFNKRTNLAVSEKPADYAWLILHFYL